MPSLTPLLIRAASGTLANQYTSIMNTLRRIVWWVAKALARVTAILGFLIVAGVLGLVLYIWVTRYPPSESGLIQGFQDHRAQFEQIRDMLMEDKQLERLADWGVATTTSPVPRMPPDGGFPVQRYELYMRLLHQVNAQALGRREGTPASPNILMWGWGFAGETVHVGIIWLEQPPQADRVVATFGDYKGLTGKHREWSYRHIDSNWYLWTDI